MFFAYVFVNPYKEKRKKKNTRPIHDMTAWKLWQHSTTNQKSVNHQLLFPFLKIQTSMISIFETSNGIQCIKHMDQIDKHMFHFGTMNVLRTSAGLKHMHLITPPKKAEVTSLITNIVPDKWSLKHNLFFWNWNDPFSTGHVNLLGGLWLGWIGHSEKSSAQKRPNFIIPSNWSTQTHPVGDFFQIQSPCHSDLLHHMAQTWRREAGVQWCHGQEVDQLNVESKWVASSFWRKGIAPPKPPLSEMTESQPDNANTSARIIQSVMPPRHWLGSFLLLPIFASRVGLSGVAICELSWERTCTWSNQN